MKRTLLERVIGEFFWVYTPPKHFLNLCRSFLLKLRYPSCYNSKVMLKIRLSRTGKKHQPHYRVVVTEARSKRDSKNVDQIGHWHPTEEKLVIDKKAYQEWVGKGAQPTDAVRKLVKS